MAKIDFYYTPMSAPCRAVLLTANAVQTDLNLKEFDLMKGENRKPEFLKINPQHTIPTIVDGDFALWESRAILMYLADKFDKEGKIYPKDAKLRAKVNFILFFDQGTVYERFASLVFPVIFFNTEDKLSEEKKAKLEEALDFLETFLSSETAFVAGNKVTIGDHSLSATVSTIKDTGVIAMTKYQRINDWLERCAQSIDKYEELNSTPSKEFGVWIKERLAAKNIIL